MHGPLSSIPASDKLFVARVHPRYVNLLPPLPPLVPPNSFFLHFLFVFPASGFRYVASSSRVEREKDEYSRGECEGKKRGEGETRWRAAQGLEARIKRRKKRNVETR